MCVCVEWVREEQRVKEGKENFREDVGSSALNTISIKVNTVVSVKVKKKKYKEKKTQL